MRALTLLFQMGAIRQLDRLLPLAALVCAVMSILRRKHDIGGWLFYFYYWTSGVLVIYVIQLGASIAVFHPSFRSENLNHEALILAVIPRLLGMFAVAFVSVMLLLRRNQSWLERLRLLLIVEFVISGISVWLDFKYFPSSLRWNVARLVGLFLWLLYFYVSERVHRVFLTKDWTPVVASKTLELDNTL